MGFPSAGERGLSPRLSPFNILLEVFMPFHAVRHEDKTKQNKTNRGISAGMSERKLFFVLDEINPFRNSQGVYRKVTEIKKQF